MGHRMDHAEQQNRSDFKYFISVTMTYSRNKAAIGISSLQVPIVQHYLLYDNKNNSRYYL